MHLAKYILPIAAAATLWAAAPANAGPKVTNAGGSVSPSAIGGANCANSRVCAYIGQNALGTPVFRSKGVVSVFSPLDGVTCIKPVSTVPIAKIVPSVTVEWGQSLGSDLLAFFQNIKVNCPSGYIEVRTYDLTGNLNPRVAFTIADN